MEILYSIHDFEGNEISWENEPKGNKIPKKMKAREIKFSGKNEIEGNKIYWENEIKGNKFSQGNEIYQGMKFLFQKMLVQSIQISIQFWLPIGFCQPDT